MKDFQSLTLCHVFFVFSVLYLYLSHKRQEVTLTAYLCTPKDNLQMAAPAEAKQLAKVWKWSREVDIGPRGCLEALPTSLQLCKCYGQQKKLMSMISAAPRGRSCARFVFSSTLIGALKGGFLICLVNNVTLFNFVWPLFLLLLRLRALTQINRNWRWPEKVNKFFCEI